MSLSQSQFILASIVLGLSIVFAAYFFSDTTTASQDVLTLKRTADQNLYGESKAPITIVEFSDVECPFCARLHPTLKQIVEQSDGGINWEYRHLPLPSHKNAELGAIALECVADSKGSVVFWKYLEKLLADQGKHSEKYYTDTALAFGVSETSFTKCLNDQKIIDRVSTDRQTARAFGGSGTPFSVIQFADGTTKSVSGALPFADWQKLFNN